ncbi:hypothetical protein BDN67DRAFT_983559 [Paxillus ammoniavirescens]|nr:hypothetical protein BDN67DRAFT_983559 [Paxillus ammoniavirescens]
MNRKMEWAFTVIMGGPNPLAPGDKNLITSLHVDCNKFRNDFSEAYPQFDTDIAQKRTLTLYLIDKGGNDQETGQEADKNGTDEVTSGDNDNSDGEGDKDNENKNVKEGEEEEEKEKEGEEGEGDNEGGEQAMGIIGSPSTASYIADLCIASSSAVAEDPSAAAKLPFMGTGYPRAWQNTDFSFSSLLGNNIVDYSMFAPQFNPSNLNNTPTSFTPPSSASSFPPVHGTPAYQNHYYANSVTPPTSWSHTVAKSAELRYPPFSFGNPLSPFPPQSSASPLPPLVIPLTDQHSPGPLGDTAVQPASPHPPTEPGLINLPQTTILDTMIDDTTGGEGHAKCKHIPSQCAHSTPSDLASEAPKKKNTKCPALSGDEEGSKKANNIFKFKRRPIACILQNLCMHCRDITDWELRKEALPPGGLCTTIGE